MGGPASNEPPAYLARAIEFAPSKRPSTNYGVTRSIICRHLNLEQVQDALGTVRRPRGDNATVSFTQRLRGRHASILARCPQAERACGDAHHALFGDERSGRRYW
jgi:hypothetical protein